MIIQEAVYTTCSECGRLQLVSDEVYGCDGCGKQIDPFGDDNLLEMVVFYNDVDKYNHLHFCSWRCVFNRLAQIDRTDVKSINLPYLEVHGNAPGTGIDAFWLTVNEW